MAACKELKSILQSLDKVKLQEFGAENGINWSFTPPDAPWYNRCAVKRSITVIIGEQVLKQVLVFSKFQTVPFEVGNLVNERPIGRHPTDVSDGFYLCPNDLLLGTCTSRITSGPFKPVTNPTQGFRFAESLVN